MTTAGRLGVLGGTFDPIHVGHIDAGEAARRALSLDRILVIPAHDPPHRPSGPHASGFHRFALAALTLDDMDAYRVSDMEMQREGRSYTAVTLADLHAQGWEPTRIFFIIGTDAFADVASWYDYPAILDAAHFVVIARAGTTIDAALAKAPALRARVRATGDAADLGSTAIFLVETKTADVSSSGIRAQLCEGRSIRGLVHPAVERYIERYHLYREPRSAGSPGHTLHGED